MATKKIQSLKLSELEVDPTNVRTTEWKSEDSELIRSIKEKGVMDPIMVRPVSDDDTDADYWIVCGSRRYNASIDAGRSEIPATVRDLSDEEARELSFMENEQRKNLSNLEKAIAVQEQWDDINGQMDREDKVDYFKEGGFQLGETQIRRLRRIARLPNTVKAVLGDKEAQKKIDSKKIEKIQKKVNAKSISTSAADVKNLDEDTLGQIETKLEGRSDEEKLESLFVAASMENKKKRRRLLTAHGSESVDLYDSITIAREPNEKRRKRMITYVRDEGLDAHDAWRISQKEREEIRKAAVNFVKEGMDVEAAIEKAQQVPMRTNFKFSLKRRAYSGLENAALDKGEAVEDVAETAIISWLKEEDYYE